jgi:hypothetical protein
MPPLFTAAQCNEARHLLRAILREVTYLPDTQARTYIAKLAIGRFRQYTPGQKPDDLLLQARHTQLDNARKGLTELYRANHGELKPLLKLLHLTYARIGKRRHELMRVLLHKPLENVLVDTNTLPQLTPQHIALLDSQKRACPPNTVRAQLRSWALKIPEKNTWERPMPKKRIANATREWYAKVLDRTMVPLPLLEWERLRDLSLGKIKFDGPTPRRTMSCATPDLPSPLEVSLGLVPINSPRVILDNASKSLHGHRLTARFMKRCWASVFAQCPVMSWIETCQKWSVDWGCDVLNREATSRFTDESTFGET